MLRRGVNVGFSGGEKKRNEMLQMALFEPSLCILDEMDSGLDIDALRVAADGVNALRSPERAMVVITHYQRLLNYIVPDFVHVMSRGRVVKSGGKELALELEATGYAQFEDAAAGADDDERCSGKDRDGPCALSDVVRGRCATGCRVPATCSPPRAARVRRPMTRGPAAPAGRGMEIYRPARADARGAAARAGARRGGARGARAKALKPHADRGRPQARAGRRRLRAELSDVGNLEAGLAFHTLRESAGKRRRASGDRLIAATSDPGRPGRCR